MQEILYCWFFPVLEDQVKDIVSFIILRKQLIEKGESIHVSIPNDSRMSELYARIYFDPDQRRWMSDFKVNIYNSPLRKIL